MTSAAANGTPMWNKFYAYGISACLVVIGIGALIQSGYYDTRFEQYIDFGPYHQWVGAALIAVGIFFVYKVSRSHRGR